MGKFSADPRWWCQPDNRDVKSQPLKFMTVSTKPNLHYWSISPMIRITPMLYLSIGNKFIFIFIYLDFCWVMYPNVSARYFCPLDFHRVPLHSAPCLFYRVKTWHCTPLTLRVSLNFPFICNCLNWSAQPELSNHCFSLRPNPDPTRKW